MNKKMALPSMVFACIILFFLAIAIIPGLNDLVYEADNSLWPYPGSNLRMDYLFGAIWALAIGLSIFLWPVKQEDKPALLWVYAAKTVMALGIMLIYEWYFGFDCDGYYAILPQFAFKGFQYGMGTYNVRQIAWLHLQMIPDSFHAAKVSFSTVGLIAIYLFYRSMVVFLKRDDIRFFYFIAFFPTVIFWSSFLGKDPIALMGMALYVYGVVRWKTLGGIVPLMILGMGILISTYIRPWYSFIMLVPFLGIVMLTKRNFIMRLLVGIAIIMAVQAAVGGVGSLFRFSDEESLMDFRNRSAHGFEGGGSSFAVADLSDIAEVGMAAPYGIFTALFRPFPWEVRNLFALLLSIENMIVLLMTAYILSKIRLRVLMEPLVIWGVTLTMLWGTCYGLVTQNFGALSRYKLQIMPVLASLIVMAYVLNRRQMARPEPY